MKKRIKFLIAAVLITTVFTTSALSLSACSSLKETSYTLDTDTIRVGIISDTQLTANYDGYAENFKKSLTYLKERGIDLLIFAGDYSDLGTKDASENAKKIYDEVFEEKPLCLAVMGNHDYWLANFVDCWEIPFKSKMRNRMYNVFGEDCTETKIINGYTFIALSPEDGSMEGKYDTDSAKEALDKAVKRDPSKPIFVVTHQPPVDTIKGSSFEGNGNSQLNDLFKNYPNVVSISGHLHYSMLDETNIMQKDYTAIGTQSLSYVDFAPGYEPIGKTADIQANPMLMYMTVKDNNVEIERIFVNDGQEYDANGRYSLSFPYDKQNAIYGEDRKDKVGTPYFDEYDCSVTDIEGDKYINFAAAKHSGLVTEYRLQFIKDGQSVTFVRDGKNTDTLKYWSDFYMGKNNEYIKLLLPDELQSGNYTVKIYPMDCYGNCGDAASFDIVLR